MGESLFGVLLGVNSVYDFPQWLWLLTLAPTFLSLALCFVPLFNLLAYEYCLAVGLLAALTSAMIGFGAADSADRPAQAIGNGALLALGAPYPWPHAHQPQCHTRAQLQLL